MSRRTLAKHTPYFEVLEALQGTDACAFCDLEIAAQRRYFDSLLYEHVNDPGVRRELVRSRGYCARHAHALVGFQDFSGIAILYQDQVELALAFLTGYAGVAPRRRSSCDRAPDAWATGVRCPACRHQRDVRRDTISTVIAWAHEPDLAAGFARAPGPCAPPLIASLDAGRDHTVRQTLMEAHLVKLQALANEPREFRRKSGVDGRDEPLDPKRDAWRRAVPLMAGNPEVF